MPKAPSATTSEEPEGPSAAHSGEPSVQQPFSSDGKVSTSTGSLPKASRLSSSPQGPSTPPFAPIPATVQPATKTGTPTAAPPAGKQRSSRSGAKTVKRRHGGAGGASSTSALYGISVTSGLQGLGDLSNQGPSPFINSAAVGYGGVVDLRPPAPVHSTAKSRGGTSSSNHSPVATPSATSTRTAGVEPASKILDFLYLGSVHDAQDMDFLSRNHIAFIINVSMEEYWTVDKNIVVYPFKIEDNTNANISVLFKPSSLIIEKVRRAYYQAKKNNIASPPCILIHCQKGRSRSPTLVLAYLIARNGWSVAEALEYVCRRRRFVEPNLAFMDALRELQESLSPEERTKRYATQTLLVKNISAKTSKQTIKAFFERRVGCVRDVVMHCGTAGSCNHEPKAASSAAAMEGSKAVGPMAVPPPSPGAHTTSNPSAPVGNIPPSEKTDGAKQCPAVGEKAGRDVASDTATEHALCLVFFACFEDVKRARELAAAHPDELLELGPVPGKEIKLTDPIKAIGAVNSTTTSFAGPTSSAATAAAAAVATSEPSPGSGNGTAPTSSQH